MPPLRDWIDPAGVPVRILTRRSRGRRKDWVFAGQVAYTIWRLRHTYDVVYFLMQGLHLLTGLQVAHFLGKPIVMKIGGSRVVPEMRRSRAGRLELDWMQKWRIPVMILNQGMVEEALADGFSQDQLIWMPNPVDVDEFRPLPPAEAAEWRRRHDIPMDAFVIIYTGRLSHEKGLTGLLQGFSRASRGIPQALLLLAGDGALRPELERLGGELGLNSQNLRFLGRIPSSEIPSWLAASDIFALTSPSEGFSCALVEAMSVGLPSVVTAIPANLQLIEDGEHGLTVPFDDHDAIAQAFVRLCRDSALRQAMSVASRQRVVDNYSTIKVVERYEALFSGLLA
jgi:glycosyltransferase involved in cell wall biosynthesis